MSTKPGMTRAPSASTTRPAEPCTAPTSAIRPSLMATSAVRGGPPVPSTTVPDLMMTSYSCTTWSLRSDGANRLADAGDGVLGETVADPDSGRLLTDLLAQVG